ncbi:T9SS type A sorting domain-containing protein [uncultured Chryseobacterium sp.]|uniref:T9SS type A sorting domain-containing protein n=1 Tax=uncultured Chryseobacterium sp. TaxID=259322 RepID=UPI0025CDD113|nr:T9SS type A sorting domain-containing protein [uncultured Chryseobacterium sp.]
MKKLFFSAALFAVSFMYGQLPLEHSFANERTLKYSTPTETYYISKTTDNKLKIYNSNYSLYKTVNVPMPVNYDRLSFAADHAPFVISKNVFNNDNKFEFLLGVYHSTNTFAIKLLLIDEDGNLIQDFHPNATATGYAENFDIFHDSLNNVNKLIVYSDTVSSSNEWIPQTDIYTLPTTVLSAKEIQAVSTLSAFPIPASTVLNITNPGTGAGKVQVFDASGKIVADQSFSGSDPKISIDVQNLPKGTYIYRIGNASAKFTKN